MGRLWVTWAGFLTLIMVAVPALLIRSGRTPAPGPGPGEAAIAVYLPTARRVVQMPLAEYLVGVVAAELPAAFHDEAIKAQMVVARTYAIYHMRRYGGRGCDLHPAADACGTHEHGQAFTTLESLAARLGDGPAHDYWRRLQAAERATRNLILTYAGKPINAVYHSSSGTTTEDAAAVWGQAVPYLRPVPDPWGRAASRYQETVTLSQAELAQRLGLPAEALTAGGGRSPIIILERTPGGRVALARVGAALFTGRDLRERLGLRSAQMQVRPAGEAVAITTLGYGHGVGMSQYGAEGLARRGHAFDRILAHYYPGTRLQRFEPHG